jgi:hypothetical protein
VCSIIDCNCNEENWSGKEKSNTCHSSQIFRGRGILTLNGIGHSLTCLKQDVQRQNVNFVLLMQYMAHCWAFVITMADKSVE